MNEKNLAPIGFAIFVVGILSFYMFSGSDSGTDEKKRKSLFAKRSFKAKTRSFKVEPLEKLELSDKLVKKDDRYLVGASVKPIKSLPKKAKAINKPSKNLKKKILKKLGESEVKKEGKYDREMEVDFIASGLVAHPKYLLNVEAIKINFKQKNGEPGSFEAIVDSENGDILHSYNHEYDKSLEPSKDLREYYPVDSREGQTANKTEIDDLERKIASQDFEEIDQTTEMTEEKIKDYYKKIYEEAETKTYFKNQEEEEKKKNELIEKLQSQDL